jgi:hypothetical protein
LFIIKWKKNGVSLEYRLELKRNYF